MRPPREIQEFRDKEFEEAKSEAEVHQLLRKWDYEDDARARAADWRNRELAELRREVAHVRRFLFHPTKSNQISEDLMNLLVEAVHAAGGVFYGKKIKALEDRCAELEGKVRERVGVQYEGVWDAERAYYPAGAAVTRSGALWIARNGAIKGAQPGKAADWTLAVKSGRDGRDARPNGKGHMIS